jgi:hypothetical protein
MADRVYSEAEIPDGYNQPKDEDDGTYQTPFRKYHGVSHDVSLPRGILTSRYNRLLDSVVSHRYENP